MMIKRKPPSGPDTPLRMNYGNGIVRVAASRTSGSAALCKTSPLRQDFDDVQALQNYNLRLTAIAILGQNIARMRVFGILLLIAMSLMTLSPLAIGTSYSPKSDITHIITLDVCHVTDGAGPAGAELPACGEDTFSLVRLESLQFISPQTFLVQLFNLPFQEDRPPQA